MRAILFLALIWLVALVSCQKDHNYGQRTKPLRHPSRARVGMLDEMQSLVESAGVVPVQGSKLDGSYHSSIEYETKAPENSALTPDQGIDLNHRYDEKIHASKEVILSTKDSQNFKYSEEGSEVIDQKGLVHGTYSYIDKDGTPSTIDYEAGPEIGFVVKKLKKNGVIQQYLSQLGEKHNVDSPVDEFLKQNKPTIPQTDNIHQLESRYKYATAIRNRPIRMVRLNRKRSLSKPIVTDQLSQPSESVLPDGSDKISSKPEINASYKFGFSADGQTRSEEADAEGNVQGKYSYIDADGLKTSVEYEAGALKGFVIKKILKEPKLEIKESVKESQDTKAPKKDIGLNKNSNNQSILSEKTLVHDDEVKTSNNKINTDGSYSFSYETPEQMREESADANNRVKGKFSFINQDDGKRRMVNYVADAENGFVARGSHLPVVSKETILTDVYKKINHDDSKQETIHNLAVDAKTDAKTVSNTNISNDGIYSNTVDSSSNHLGVATSGTGYVQSQIYYSDNGQLQIVDYKQSSNTDQVSDKILSGELFGAPTTSSINASENTDDTDELAGSSDVILDLEGIRRAVAVKEKTTHKSEVKSNESFPTQLISLKATQNLTKILPDGSYTFSYVTDDDKRQQSVDSSGNVLSSYQYKTDDNTRVLVVFQTQARTNLSPEPENVSNNVASDDEQTVTELSEQKPKTQVTSTNKDNIPKKIDTRSVRKGIKRRVVYRAVPQTKYINYNINVPQEGESLTKTQRKRNSSYNYFPNINNHQVVQSSASTEIKETANKVYEPIKHNRGNVKYRWTRR